MVHTTLKIAGMTCQSCVRTIRNHLANLPGVLQSRIFIGHGVVEHENWLSPSQIIDHIAEVGFDATNALSDNMMNNDNTTHTKIAIAIDADRASPSIHENASDRKTHVATGDEPVITKVKLQIRGMTCASCVASIERALKAHIGVQDVIVSLLLESADVALDLRTTTIANVISLVNQLGYECSEKTSSLMTPSSTPSAAVHSFILSIRGMTCASCVRTIENHLSKLAGIENVVVNLIMEEATVRAQSSVSADSLVDEINSLGYTAALKSKSDGSSSTKSALSSSADGLRESQMAMVRYYRNLLIFSCIFGVPVLVLSMVLSYVPNVKHALMLPVGNTKLELFALLLWIPSTLVYVFVGRIFFQAAWSGLKHKNANMSLLVTLGTTAAYIYALISVISSLASSPVGDTMGGAMFFETTSTLLVFIVLGRYLEAMAKGKTSEALTKLMSMQAAEATRLSLDKQGNVIGEQTIPLDELCVGDIVKVIRGSKVPADGVVTFGESTIDEAMITGESMPVTKTVGDQVIGSTVNQDGLLHVRVTGVGSDTTLSHILRLMEDAQASKAPIQAFADKLSGVFVPIVVMLSTLTFIVWAALSYSGSIPSHWYQDEGSFLFAFLFGIAVMVIACPCALGLATPTAVMVGTGVGASMGILIKGGAALEVAHKVTAFVFDKTGTLTVGKPAVTQVTLFTKHMKLDEVCFLAGSAELSSEHVLGRTIVEFARSSSSVPPLQDPTDFAAVNGRGLRARVASRVVLIGNRAWLSDNGVMVSSAVEECMTNFELQGQTALVMAVDGSTVACIALADVVKSESASIVSHLRRHGISVWMCTGDNRRTADVIAKQLGIDDVVSEALPSSKYDLIRKLQSEGHIVAMIGDGINDSPALAQADLGFSVGAGTDIAMEAADIVLMKNDLRDVITALDLSRKTFRRIQWNFVWALGYNVLGIPIAAGLFYPAVKLRLPPELAALAMALSSVSVVLSSLSLKWYRKPVVRQLDATGHAITMAPDHIELHGVTNITKMDSPTQRPTTADGATSSRKETQTADADVHSICCPCEQCTCSSADDVDAPDPITATEEPSRRAFRYSFSSTSAAPSHILTAATATTLGLTSFDQQHDMDIEDETLTNITGPRYRVASQVSNDSVHGIEATMSQELTMTSKPTKRACCSKRNENSQVVVVHISDGTVLNGCGCKCQRCSCEVKF